MIKDPNNLRISTTVNGKKVQDSSTKDMIFNVKKMINFISQGTTLLPGDVIMTGTPEGVQSLALSHSRRWNGKETAIMVERWRHRRSRARERG